MTAGLFVRVRGIGLLGPGLPDWATGKALLRQPADWAAAPTVLPAPERLPAAERRRCGAIVKLSLAVADQAVAMADADAKTLATVFTSSSGDVANCHAMCEALAQPERAVSPTRFTNSVHNVPAGYWHIACGSRAPSSSLCGFDASFSAGLLEAALQCAQWRRPVLLVAADIPYPEPLASKRPLASMFGAALLLDVADASAGILVRVETVDLPDADSCNHAALDALRLGAPAARSLPLLQALAATQPTSVVLDGLQGALLRVECLPETAP
jgi:hypothetical protein